MSEREWKPGDEAVWLHQPRGGYGYTVPVDVRVLAVYRLRALIEAPLASGKGTKRVRVYLNKLRSPQAEAAPDAGRERIEP